MWGREVDGGKGRDMGQRQGVRGAEPTGIDGGRGSYKNAKKTGKKISKAKTGGRKKSLRCEAYAA